MKRRTALRNMGLALGYAAAAPTALGILQSCKGPVYADWVPTFLGEAQGRAMAQMMDVMLPKTDTPSATELNLHVFADRFLDQTLDEESKTFFKPLINQFFDGVLESAGKDDLANLRDKDFAPALDTYLAPLDEETELAHGEALQAYFMALESGGNPTLDAEVGNHFFAKQFRGLCIMAYQQNETIGEEVLAYDPIPGEYLGCVDLEEMTGGVAWSL